MDRPGPVSPLREIVGAVVDLADSHPIGDEVCVGLSGGADSLALTAGAVAAGLAVTALVIDHGLQKDSRAVADRAAEQARGLGARAQVIGVSVSTRGGPEGAARRARHDALDDARDGAPVLLAHTLDDQAETVLLGLGRGSGPRSIAGMVAWASPWGRPLLALRRSVTHAACDELGLEPWHDPHNTDPRFARARLRAEVLPVLEDILGGGVAPALARTARRLREDAEVLDALADDVDAGGGTDGLDRTVLAALPAAIRRRVVRRWMISVGATEPTERLILAVDDLVFDPRPHAAVAIGGDSAHRLSVVADGVELTVERTPR
ncbi:tRNA(Ile)-lysidine synthetase [Williamsia sp. Leaf354]|uniref:tRNA lysidine(34) synthetase TilS n=1 Tax=Williamsia sp. Leaf354 TaxID=1736349 RepID=UPI0006FFF3E6|nr:tRNA lysidine(34) synthetase TilS [Williamsia sp. Leaf354]KQR96430.1 tRNA(Ile)-lysidine synthetase [Williamsia sp. Leaf354]